MSENVDGILHFWPSFIADFVHAVYVGNFYQGVAVMAFVTLSAIISAEVSRSAESSRVQLRSKVILSVALALWLANLIVTSLATIEAASSTQIIGGSYRAVISGMGIVLSAHLIVGLVMSVVIPLILLLPRNQKDDEVIQGAHND
ncbi:MAG: hypothetical protein RIS25_1190 [Actinomycetota bacterium]|jgi:hypothetical protein